MTILQAIASAVNWNLRTGENFRSVSPAGLFGIDPSTTTGLTFGYLGGYFAGFTVANGTLTLTASTTNYVVVNRSTAVVSVATTPTNWNNQVTYLRLYSFVAGASSFTIGATSDWRQAFGLDVAGISNPMTTAEDFIKGGVSGAPVRVGVGGNGQVLTVTAGVVGWANSSAGFTNPMTTAGDVITGGVAGAAGRLAVGNTGDVLTVVAGAPAWAPPGIEQNSQSAAYTLVLGDKGKQILHPTADTTARIYTIPANSSVAYPINTAITFVNQHGAGVITIAIATDAMYFSPTGSTGSRTLAANGIATAVKVTATEWMISGSGLT